MVIDNKTPTPPQVIIQQVGMISGMKNAARYVGVSVRTLFNWIEDGRVKVIRHSKRKLFFRPTDLVKAVEQIGEDYAGRH